MVKKTKRSVAELAKNIPSPKEIRKAANLKESVNISDSIKNTKVSINTFKKLETAEEAILASGLDPLTYSVEKFTRESKEANVKNVETGLYETRIFTKFQIWCKREVPEFLSRASEKLAKRAAGKPFKLKSVRYNKKKKDKNVVVFGATDVHYGVSEWTLEEASNVYRAAVESLIEKTSGLNIDKLIFIIGSDFLHVDKSFDSVGTGGTTTSGTNTGCVAPYDEIYMSAADSVIESLEMLRQYCPTKVVYVPGNHDQWSGHHLAVMAKHKFSSVKNMEFDVEFERVKYHHDGKILIGMTHGDRPKAAIAGKLMTHHPAWSASTACRELLTGHLHHRKVIAEASSHESYGLVTRILPSMAPKDYYHDSIGLTMSRRSCNSHVYNLNYGHVMSIDDPVEMLINKYN